MKIIVVTLLYILIGFIEIKPSLKSTRRIEITWYIVLIMYSYILSILLMIDANIPSPLKPISKFISYIFGLKM